MQYKIKYGKDNYTIKTDEKCKILEPKKIRLKDEKDLIKKALKNPIKKKPLQEFLENTEQILIIVNDGTRPTPTAKILSEINKFFDLEKKAKFIVACGSHRPPNSEEYKFIFGDLYSKFKNNILVHDAKNKKYLKLIGKTKKGTKIAFNKVIFEYDKIITINSVEPHYFAGFTGGRKSFLPGVAGYETIEMNHKHALNNKSCTLKLENNPVHEDMMDALSFIKNLDVFSIQIVLTPDAKIYDIITGDIIDSFIKATKKAKEIFCVPLKNKANIVVTVALPPMDLNLYQSQKALENGRLALEEEGIIILVSECHKGIGPDNFMKLLESAKHPKEVLDYLKNNYKLGYHKAGKIAELATESKIYAVTNIDKKIIKKAFMKPYKNIQDAIEDAIKEIKIKNKEPKLVILPNGCLTVPFV